MYVCVVFRTRAKRKGVFLVRGGGGGGGTRNRGTPCRHDHDWTYVWHVGWASLSVVRGGPQRPRERPCKKLVQRPPCTLPQLLATAFSRTAASPCCPCEHRYAVVDTCNESLLATALLQSAVPMLTPLRSVPHLTMRITSSRRQRNGMRQAPPPPAAPPWCYPHGSRPFAFLFDEFWRDFMASCMSAGTGGVQTQWGRPSPLTGLASSTLPAPSPVFLPQTKERSGTDLSLGSCPDGAQGGQGVGLRGGRGRSTQPQGVHMWIGCDPPPASFPMWDVTTHISQPVYNGRPHRKSQWGQEGGKEGKNLCYGSGTCAGQR